MHHIHRLRQHQQTQLAMNQILSLLANNENILLALQM
jgi:hypothetical protein